MTGVVIRRARTRDVAAIEALMQPLVERRILLGKDRIVLYEAIQEFRVAVDSNDRVIGCGALHVIWEDLGEIRTLAVEESSAGRGVGGALLSALEAEAVALGVSRLFCLTFETGFFASHGFETMLSAPHDEVAYVEIARSTDEGVAEFLDLARVKPNTLGNTRMLKHLSPAD